MLAKIKSRALDGLNGYAVTVEVDINSGLPGIEMVGLASTATKEAKERVRSAVKNSGFKYPTRRITVNLAPADTKKEGATLDLPVAVGILAASEQICGEKYKQFNIIGELSLDGRLNHVNGIMPLLISAVQRGESKFIIPEANKKEASFIEGAEVYALSSLKEVADFLSGEEREPVEISSYEAALSKAVKSVDFKDVKGQSAAKRAVEIAVAGGHNVLMSGPPGAGKTMLARCVPSIMPEMSFKEAIEVTKIHSVAGLLDSEVGIVTERPFRAPHHTVTVPSLIGGGSNARPGEVSLANHGVLFLDEVPEYSRRALETLRQPLEDRRVCVSRIAKTAEYPANFMLIASMNPCPCGNFGSKTQKCTCTAQQINSYASRLSGPLLDRIDLQIEVDGVSYDEFRGEEAECSEDIKKRITAAREIQRKRFEDDGILLNSEMGTREVNRYCKTDEACERLLKKAFEKMNLSARGTTRILKVARTIADLEGCENIRPQHIAEAVQYRGAERRLGI